MLSFGIYAVVKAANDTNFTGNSQVPCFEYYTGFYQCAKNTNPQLSPFNAQAGQLDNALETVGVQAYEKFSSCVGAICQFYPLQMMESATASVNAGGGNSPAGYGLWLGNRHLLTFQVANGSDTNGTTFLPLGNVLATGLFAFDSGGNQMAELTHTGHALDINIKSTSSKQTACPNTVNINQAANTQLVAVGAGTLIYVCNFTITNAVAQSISLVEGTGAVCATGTAGVYGDAAASAAVGTTGQISMVSSTPWGTTKTAGDALCLYQSGATNISGILTYFQG